MRILIIDTEPNGAGALAGALSAHGHQIQVSLSGRDGLWMAQEWPPDVVVCDLSFCDQSARMMCRDLRALRTYWGTRLVCWSGVPPRPCWDAGAGCGFDAVIARGNLRRLLAYLTVCGEAACPVDSAPFHRRHRAGASS